MKVALKCWPRPHVEPSVGLFGRKKAAETSPHEDADADDEAALEAVAALLRIFGRSVVSLDGTPTEAVTRRFEDWARHVLVRSLPPDRERADDEGTQRDWPGLQRFVGEHRKAEALLVAETVAGLREAARSFIRAMTRLRMVGDSADLGVRQQIDRLRVVAGAASPLELKRGVLAAADALDVAVESRRSEEEAVAAALAAQVKDLSQQLGQALKESGIDALTRLPNRKTLDAAVADAVEVGGVTREPICLVMLDLDDFKAINDTHGHAAGDDVLKGVADAMSRVILRQRDLVARYAGDEFCVLLRDCNATTATQLAGRIADALRGLGFERNGARFNVRASFGIATLQVGDTVASFVERADTALYRSKREGKDAVRCG